MAARKVRAAARSYHDAAHQDVKLPMSSYEPRGPVSAGSTMISSARHENRSYKTSMPTKLNTEIVAAAIAGFEQQKKRLDAQIAELRNMLSPVVAGADTPARKERRRMSAAARARIAAAQRKRWAARSKLKQPHPPRLLK
jgi:hypothetical protein